MHRLVLLLPVLCLGFAALLLPLSSTLAAPAPVPKPNPGKEDLKKMQGDWMLVSRTTGGRPTELGVLSMRIAGSQFTYPLDSDATLWASESLSLDGRKKPGWFDAGGLVGVYRLEGDTLTLCHATGDADRPKDFDAKKRGQCVEVYKRKR